MGLLFGYPIYSDAGRLHQPSLSGGSWVETLPLTNLQTRDSSEVARSTDALTTSTRFTVDLGTARDVRVLALLGHNLSLGAVVRWRGSQIKDDFSDPVHDTGWIDVHQHGLSAEDLLYFAPPCIHVTDATHFTRYWRCEIDDTENAAGYVEVGRLVIAGAIEPSIGPEYGAQIGVDDPTERILSDGRATHYRQRDTRLTWSFTIGHLPEAEAHALQDMRRRLGKGGQLLLVWDTAAMETAYQHSGLAVHREMSPVELAYFGGTRNVLALIEEL